MIKLLPVVGNDSRDFFCLFPGLLPGRVFCLPSGMCAIFTRYRADHARRWRTSRAKTEPIPGGYEKTPPEMSGDGLAVCCFALPMHDGTDAFREGNFIGQNLYRAIKRQRTGISCFPVRPI